jgi:hypothetical protein
LADWDDLSVKPVLKLRSNVLVPLPLWFERTYLPSLFKLSPWLYVKGPGVSLIVWNLYVFGLIFDSLASENLEIVNLPLFGSRSTYLYVPGPGLFL